MIYLDIHIGDFVTRKSYNNDIVFKIIDIIEETVYLKGYDIRLLADCNISDLVNYMSIEDEAKIAYEIYSNIKSSTPIVTKNLILKPTDKSYHNKFVDYLREYIEYIGIKNGIEDVINIDVKNGISSVSGFNVLTGMSQIKRLPSLLENLLSREIPLLEFDNMIIRNIPDNKLITRQLFNFNICFNLDDIITPVLYNLLKGDNIIIRLNVGVTREDGKLSKDNLFPKRDFFSNYDYIQKKFCGFERVERSF